MGSTGESPPLLLTSVPVSVSCYLCCVYPVGKRMAPLWRALAGVFVPVFASFLLFGGVLGKQGVVSTRLSYGGDIVKEEYPIK